MRYLNGTKFRRFITELFVDKMITTHKFFDRKALTFNLMCQNINTLKVSHDCHYEFISNTFYVWVVTETQTSNTVVTAAVTMVTKQKLSVRYWWEDPEWWRPLVIQGRRWNDVNSGYGCSPHKTEKNKEKIMTVKCSNVIKARTNRWK